MKRKSFFISIILSFMFCLIFSLNVEAKTDVTLDVYNNDYSIIIKTDNLELSEKETSRLENEYDITIEENKKETIVTKEYKDFISIDPDGLTRELNSLLKVLLSNSDIEITGTEELVGFVYSGTRYFTFDVKGIKDNFNFTINYPNAYILFKQVDAESVVEEFDKIEVDLTNGQYIIQILSYEFIDSVIIDTEINKKDIYSKINVTFNDKINHYTLESIVGMLEDQGQIVSINNNTVTIDKSYNSGGYFSALHYKDIYDMTGIVSYISIEESGMYTKSNNVKIECVDNGGIENVKYNVTYKNGKAKNIKGNNVEKDGGTVSVQLKNGEKVSFDLNKTNSSNIVVTIVVIIIFSIVAFIVYLLSKRK